MGYNNNNAGMHMIWHRKYNEYYDDLDYFNKHQANKKAKKKIEKKIIQGNKIIIEQEEAKVEKQNINEQTINKPTGTKKNRDNRKTKPLSIYDYRPKAGTEKVIPESILFNVGLVARNVMIYSLKNKKDIYSILKETEEMMKRDERLNSEWTGMAMFPIMEKAEVFLAILADKLDCTIQEFFINDKDATKKFVYKFLEGIGDWEWEEGEVYEDGSAEIVIRNFSTSPEFNEIAWDIDYSLNEMNLTLEKIIDKDDNCYYIISYGSLSIRPISAFDYMLKGAYLWKEETGMLKDLVDRLIENNPEWIVNDDDDDV